MNKLRTFFALAALLPSLALADGLYLETGLAVLDQPGKLPDYTQRFVTDYYACKSCKPMEFTAQMPDHRPYDINETRNPYGSIVIGYDWDVRYFARFPITIDLQLQHQSSLDTGRDRGWNSINLKIRTYLFGGSR